MAVSNQEVAAWLAANPTATDAQIAKAAADAGVSASQLSQVTGVPVQEVIERLQAPIEVESRTVDMGEGTREEYFIKGTNIPVDAPTYSYDYSGPMTESSVPTAIQDNYTVYDPSTGNVSVYSPEGAFLQTYNDPRKSGIGGFISETTQQLAPIIMAALAPGASSLLGSVTGLTGAQLAAATGATLGGGTAALSGASGEDILKGALLGGGAGYLGNVLTAPSADSIYSLANGTPNLDYMGGGQGLTSTGAANLASMGGGQGLQILAGLPSTTLAEALSTFGGVNPEALASMGLGQGITYVTPSGIVTENGTIFGGDVISELGANTGFDLTEWLNENVGAGIGDTLETIDTGVVDTMAPEITGGTGSTASETTASETTTLGDVLDVVQAGSIIGGLVGGATADQGQTGFPIVPVPSDWTSPTYGGVGQGTGLSPIDFGSRELLRGTQFERFLNPQTQTTTQAPVYQSVQDIVNAISGGFGPIGNVQTYSDQPLTGIAAYKPTPYVSNINDVIGIINSDNNINNAEAKALQLMSSPTLSGLPPQAASAIANAVSSPRSYSDVIASGVASPSNLSSMSPEVQRAWGIYQQSMVLGAPRLVAEAAYKAAGVDPTNPTGFFENLGFNTGTPTQEALAKYAPLALDQFGKSGGGALTYTIDPTTIPSNYTPPNVQTLANSGLNAYANSLLNSSLASSNPAKVQELITARANEYGVNPSTYLSGFNGQTPNSTMG